MDTTNALISVQRKEWSLENVDLSYNIATYQNSEWHTHSDESEKVRLHIGLHGAYEMQLEQLAMHSHLSGFHNNLLYTKGLSLKVKNASERIETFGINIDPSYFITLGQNTNETLQRFTEQVVQGKNAALGQEWKTNSLGIHSIVKEIIDCPYIDGLQTMFLQAKVFELIILQAALYDQPEDHRFIQKQSEKDAFLAIKEYLSNSTDQTHSLSDISQKFGINEFKLKKGFKELFGITIFAWISEVRLSQAKHLLMDSEKSIQEIAYAIGYSSPQYFSTAFKKRFGVTPKSVRKNPDFVHPNA